MKHFEFWPARVFEAPYYLYLVTGAIARKLPFKQLAKANYALDHGEIGFGSKFATQMAFDQQRFLPTELLQDSPDRAVAQALAFGERHGYPVILKPDRGRVGKGIYRLQTKARLQEVVSQLTEPYMIQQFTPFSVEFGVFFVRRNGIARISGINQKHFPAVRGDGRSTLQQLAFAHPRYTPLWAAFLQDHDLTRVPEPGEHVPLSYIGSHTLGCRFSNETSRLTETLTEAVCQVCVPQNGFNFGRLDVKAASEEAFWNGEFVVIEINGIASLPTHMFDPNNTLSEGYRIFFEHGRYLLDCANEQRHQSMPLDSWPKILRRLRQAEKALGDSHQQASAG